MDIVQLERVHGSLSAPILDGGGSPDAADDPAPDTLSADLPWPMLRHGTIHSLDLAAPVVAGSAVVLATRDPSLAAGSAVVVSAVWWLRHVSISMPFSFGEGFLGYRADPGRPQGIQEDDDFHWDWRARPVEPDDAEDDVATSIERG